MDMHDKQVSGIVDLASLRSNGLVAIRVHPWSKSLFLSRPRWFCDENSLGSGGWFCLIGRAA
jgi:hypothetical protein